VKSIVLLTLSLLVASGVNAQDCPVSWQSLARGLDYRAITCLGDGTSVDVHVVRIDPRLWQLDAAIDQNGSARDIARTQGAAFAINANFFDNPQQPLGIVMHSGTLLQSTRKSSWQSLFLVTNDGTPRIVTPSQWPKWKKSAVMAVQAGPRLVVDGHSNHGVRKGYAAARSGVCIRWNRDLLFFATPQNRKFDMWEIMRVARVPEEQGGLGCRDAMLFDGGHSTQFFVGNGDFAVGVSGDPVPVFVYAVPR
jgi:uncharacterized protein YigE (DUF2233 family)